LARKGELVRKPTIYEALAAKLGRKPSHNELIADVNRILGRVSESERIHTENLARVSSPAYKRAARLVASREKTIRRNVNN
jgi:hypothetical protein